MNPRLVEAFHRVVTLETVTLATIKNRAFASMPMASLQPVPASWWQDPADGQVDTPIVLAAFQAGVSKRSVGRQPEKSFE